MVEYMESRRIQEIKLERLGDRALALLSVFIKGSLIASAEVADFAFEVFRYKSMNEVVYPSEVKAITDRLKRSGLISGNDKSGYKITKRGHWELARHRYKDNPENHIPEKWDRKWRVVIFDVPEMAHKYRDILRRAIAGYGMYQLQQSVWVYPYRCEEFIRSIKEDIGFKSEVLYMLVDKIDHQKELEREFNLL
ncbi:MAG: hypothetical protein ACKKL4_00365 [Patescibacteria group bacterium]